MTLLLLLGGQNANLTRRGPLVTPVAALTPRPAPAPQLWSSKADPATGLVADPSRGTGAGTNSATVTVTCAANTLLVAFVTWDSSPNVQLTTTVSGASLTWTAKPQAITESATLGGGAEIWIAYTASALTSQVITASVPSAPSTNLTIVTFDGADPTQTGASAVQDAQSAALFSLSVVSTRIGSWVWGIAYNWDTSTAGTPGSGQALTHSYIDGNNDAGWVQRPNTLTASVGQTITINDTAPTVHGHLAILEILPLAVVSTPMSARVITYWPSPAVTSAPILLTRPTADITAATGTPPLTLTPPAPWLAAPARALLASSLVQADALPEALTTATPGRQPMAAPAAFLARSTADASPDTLPPLLLLPPAGTPLLATPTAMVLQVRDVTPLQPSSNPPTVLVAPAWVRTVLAPVLAVLTRSTADPVLDTLPPALLLPPAGRWPLTAAQAILAQVRDVTPLQASSQPPVVLVAPAGWVPPARVPTVWTRSTADPAPTDPTQLVLVARALTPPSSPPAIALWRVLAETPGPVNLLLGTVLPRPGPAGIPLLLRSVDQPGPTRPQILATAAGIRLAVPLVVVVVRPQGRDLILVFQGTVTGSTRARADVAGAGRNAAGTAGTGRNPTHVDGATRLGSDVKGASRKNPEVS